jgi:hypothetical protein
MTTDHAAGYDARGWGHGLAAWILAAYTAEGDIVLDRDADPGVRVAAETTDRAYLTGLTPDCHACAAGQAPLSGVRLVTAHWPRPAMLGGMAADASDTQGAELAAMAGLLVPGAWLALVAPLPALTQPFTIDTEMLLSAAHAAGLGHLRTVHATAADSAAEGDRTYRCALVFRRTRHRPRPDAPSPSGPLHEDRDDG